MPLPEKLRWPILPVDVDAALKDYFTVFQDKAEEYLRTLQDDLHIVTANDVGLLTRWSATEGIFYDQDGLLYIFINDIKVCWWDWDGNWFRAVNMDNLSTNLAKTNDRQLYAYDENTSTIDIFHDGAQVIQIAEGEIIIDNQFAFKTGQSLGSATSLKWIDESINSNGDLTTFISVKEHRVLEIVGTDVKIAGALKVA